MTTTIKIRCGINWKHDPGSFVLTSTAVLYFIAFLQNQQQSVFFDECQKFTAHSRGISKTETGLGVYCDLPFEHCHSFFLKMHPIVQKYVFLNFNVHDNDVFRRICNSVVIESAAIRYIIFKWFFDQFIIDKSMQKMIDYASTMSIYWVISNFLPHGTLNMKIKRFIH